MNYNYFNYNITSDHKVIHFQRLSNVGIYVRENKLIATNDNFEK